MSAEASSHILGEPLDSIPCQCGTVVKVAGLVPLSLVECPNCHNRFPVAVKLGQFMLLKRLGRGAMGEVFEARDIALGRHVAIKVMGKKLGADAEAMKGFVREARNLAALNHRNVVQVHSIGVEKGQPYIVMELVSGGRVDQMIKKEVPGDERRLLEVAADAARGLEAAANAGMIHGDVKPANILLDQQGQGKIVDFGLARFTDTQVEGKIYGTPFYLPPELLEGRVADLRSDMYSLGASFFHALSGRPPFRAKTVKEIVRMRLREPAPNLRQFVPGIHPATAAVIARVLEKDPDARFNSYAELIGELLRARRAIDEAPVDVELADLQEAVTSAAAQSAASQSAASQSASGQSGASQSSAAGRSFAASAADASRSRVELGARTLAGSFDQDAPRKKLYLIIGAAVLGLALVIGLIVAMTRSKPADDTGGGGGGGGGSARRQDFDDRFDKAALDRAWQPLDGGGKVDGKGGGKGCLLLDEYNGQDRSTATAEPGMRRAMGSGDCVVDITAEEIRWTAQGGVLKFEVWESSNVALFMHLYYDQNEYFLELVSGGNSITRRVVGKTPFKAAPTSLSLRGAWSQGNRTWRVTYGLDGAEPSKELTGSPVQLPDAPPGDRRIVLRADQYGRDGKASMKITRVKVSYARD